MANRELRDIIPFEAPPAKLIFDHAMKLGVFNFLRCYVPEHIGFVTLGMLRGYTAWVERAIEWNKQGEQSFRDLVRALGDDEVACLKVLISTDFHVLRKNEVVVQYDRDHVYNHVYKRVMKQNDDHGWYDWRHIA